MRTITTVLPVVALSLIGLAGTATADVSTQSALDGVCQTDELCLYYNSNEQGSFSDFAQNVKDFSTVRFVADGAGKGQLVKNNAASACNKTFHLTARVYYNSN
jgi:peptidase inhibitor family I36